MERLRLSGRAYEATRQLHGQCGALRHEKHHELPHAHEMNMPSSCENASVARRHLTDGHHEMLGR